MVWIDLDTALQFAALLRLHFKEKYIFTGYSLGTSGFKTVKSRLAHTARHDHS